MTIDAFNPIRIIFDNMPYLAWMKDTEGRYIEANRTFVEFCGKSKEEIIGKYTADVFSGQIVMAYQQVEKAVIKYKKPQFFDHIYKETVTGSKWFDTYIAPLFGENGDVKGTIGFSRKISKRKHLEMELENQQRFLRTMIDTIPDFIVYKDTKSTILGCNKSCLEKFYGAADEKAVIGKTTTEVVRDNGLASNCLHKDQEVLSINQTLKIEEKYILVDGKVLEVETLKAPYHNQQGKVAGLIAISRDITERKKLEQQLRKRDEETQRELNLAARVQLDTLPKPFNGEKVRIHTLFIPYHTVSGDLYNYKWFEDEQKLRGYLVDVSGHGVATALQTATVKMLLDTILLGGREIDESDFQLINYKMTQYLYEESFAAVMYFEFDFCTNLLKIITGGINFFFAATADQCSLVPISGGFLGMFDKADIQIKTWPFKAGDIYSMMSDGVSDLIAFHGVNRKKGLLEYSEWLKKLSTSPQRSDDFSSLIIEIVRNDGELTVVCKQSEHELLQSQQKVSDFLAEVAPSCAALLEVAINEALNNSLAAGSEAYVKIKRRGNRLIVRVKDNGPGFNIATVKNKKSSKYYDDVFDQLGLQDHGRGILMMQMLCDRLIYNAKGNEVLLMKQLQ